MSEGRYVSSIMLERIFFRALFEAIVRRGIIRIKHWNGSDEENIRFHRVYEVLSKVDLINDELRRLMGRLGPNPLSGRYPAFWENLIAIHPSRIDQKYVYLYSPHSRPIQIEWLSQDLVDQMARAYVESEEREPTSTKIEVHRA